MEHEIPSHTGPILHMIIALADRKPDSKYYIVSSRGGGGGDFFLTPTQVQSRCRVANELITVL
jgi:hypothetical protein